MKRVMHRLFWAWDFDREEDWLNAWAARGWALVDVCGFRYVFEESAPGEYEYRLELLEHATSNAESRCYLDFLRDLDIECIGSYGRWTYLRRPRDGAPFDLFSDIDSKIAHLRRIEVLVLTVLLVQVTTAASLLHRRFPAGNAADRRAVGGDHDPHGVRVRPHRPQASPVEARARRARVTTS